MYSFVLLVQDSAFASHGSGTEMSLLKGIMHAMQFIHISITLQVIHGI